MNPRARRFPGAARRAALLVVLFGAAAAPGSGTPPPGVLADVVVDPNAAASVLENGELLVHYAVPIVEGRAVFTEVKGGAYTGISSWQTQEWGVRRWDWKAGVLTETWTYWSDWKPVPFAQFGANPEGAGPEWEPAFQPVSRGDLLYVPASGGTIDAVRKEDGVAVARFDPFGGTAPPRRFTAAAAASESGVYFTVLALDAANPWNSDTPGAWLVRVAPDGTVTERAFSELVPAAPGSGDLCEVSFPAGDLPFPPPPGAHPPEVPCGSPRPPPGAGLGVAGDGTVYVVSRAHFDGRYGDLTALSPALDRLWTASLRGRLHDGCGVSLPPTGTPGGCRAGAAPGVDPATNAPPAAIVDDSSSAAPVATPDGGVLYGASTRYNFAQGHLLKFGPAGDFLAAFGFGWDTTPAIYPHDGGYSILLKENHYDVGSYCGRSQFCPTPRSETYPNDPAAFFLTRLDASLVPEWRYRNTNTVACTRLPEGTVECFPGEADGFEFCVSLVAVDGRGNVYANSEDGNLYAVDPTGAMRGRLFLESADGAAYTPVAVVDGVVYTQNLGHLIAVAASAVGGCAPPAASSADGRPPICAAPPPLPVPILTR